MYNSESFTKTQKNGKIRLTAKASEIGFRLERKGNRMVITLRSGKTGNLENFNLAVWRDEFFTFLPENPELQGKMEVVIKK